MDPDFLRELLVLGAFLALYLVGSAMALRGHTADLSAVAHAPAAMAAAAGGTRLNKRRAAKAREAAERQAAKSDDLIEDSED